MINTRLISLLNHFYLIVPRKVIVFFILCVIGMLIIADLFQITLLSPNVTKNTIVYLREKDQWEDLFKILEKKECLKNYKSFHRACRWKEFTGKVKPGAYKIISGWNNNQLINILRSGAQSDIKVTFNYIRTPEDLAGRLSKQLMYDSSSFVKLLKDSLIPAKFGYTKETFPCMFIPNSYFLFWTTSPAEFLERMKREKDQFWNSSRKEKAARLLLTPVQVATLASIVQEESNQRGEKPVIAGVYLNRLKKGWPLQADPTIKFAIGNFGLHRILNEHLTVSSPYNTYKRTGLPPGPINFPEISSIEAILNAVMHDYFFFCAKPDYSGTHNFAKTLSEHNRNAQVYRAFLNKEKIWK